MTHRKAGQYLWRSAAAAAGAAILTIGLAIALPLNLPAAEAGAPPGTVPGALKNPAMNGIPPLSELAKVWSIGLGHDVAPSAPPPPAGAGLAQTPPPDLHLIGTIVEPGHCLAMLLGPAGKTIFLSVGQEIQGAKIVAIATDSITVEVDGARKILPVEKPPPPAAPKPAAIVIPEDQ